MILEVIFSTLDLEGKPNFAPMGVVWGEEKITVRPFKNTQTFRNLKDTGYGVVCITDDVLAFVKSALYNTPLPHFPARSIPGVVFQDTCYWRELKVLLIKDEKERSEINCQVINRGFKRDFLGFNRARNAVIEATILATRLQFIPQKEVLNSLSLLAQIVQKTGDEPEQLAFELVKAYILKERET
ncbi:MAG: DUF447 domain-containing protein [bacterium]